MANIRELAAPAKPQKRVVRYRPNRNSTHLYVPLPRRALHWPPVRHRGDGSDAGLTVFELAVAGAVILLARAAVVEARHAAGLRAGKKAIRRERQQVRKDSLSKLRIGGTSYQFKLAGSGGYERAVEAFDRGQGPRVFHVEVSRSALLRTAGLAHNGRHVARLSPALWRLTRPVRTGAQPLPPVLSRRRTLPDGRLRLSVRGDWLPHQHYARVAWPPPTRGGGEVALALYLLVFGMDLRPDSATTMSTATLAERLGLRQDRPAHRERALNAALDVVNSHLAAMPAAALAEAGVPSGFEIVPIGDEGGRVRVREADDAAAETGTGSQDALRKESAQPPPAAEPRTNCATTTSWPKKRNAAPATISAAASRRPSARLTA